MVGSGLKKLARKHGMEVSAGVAYGSLMGYASTLSEGSGWKRIDISTQFADPDQRTALQEAVNSVNISREYRVRDLVINHRSVNIIFLDNPGTMKKIEAFIDWFYPLLAQHGAARANVCPECGGDNVAYVQYKQGNQEPWRVRCFDCGHTVDRRAAGRHEAQGHWNREGSAG